MSVALLDRIRFHIVVNFLVGYFGYKMTEAKNNSTVTGSASKHYPNANR